MQLVGWDESDQSSSFHYANFTDNQAEFRMDIVLSRGIYTQKLFTPLASLERISAPKRKILASVVVFKSTRRLTT